MFCWTFILFYYVPILTAFSSNENELWNTPTPTVLWHGMGDSCCNPLSMGHIRKLIQTKIPGIYVVSIMLGNNVAEDTEHGFFANMNEQVQKVCEQIQADAALANGYNAIGFSQGGLFVRALAQRCPDPPIRNLISIGGPQQGVFGLPYCPASGPICNTVRHLLDYGAYEKFVQRIIVQAQYWHDPNQNEDYRHKSIFLAELNCELQCNATYKSNLLALKNFVLIKFLKDQMIQPKETAWFGYYADNQTASILPMEQTGIYQKDLIGLKTLEQTGRLHLLSINGPHLSISTKFFESEIIDKYLRDQSEERATNQLQSMSMTSSTSSSEEESDLQEET